MTGRSARWALLATLLGGAGCTNDQLYTTETPADAPIDRQVQVQGTFCALGPNQVISPIKILFVMDASSSMRKSDPTGSRAVAMVNLLNSLPQDPNVQFGVMLFSGFDTRFLTNNFTPGFVPVTSLSPSDYATLVTNILIYTNNGQTGPNSGNTDFVKPLTTIYTTIQNDLSTVTNAADSGVDMAPPRYTVIFLSDGSPTVEQDNKIFPVCQSIASLALVAESVSLNTVHLSPAPPSTCTFSSDAGLNCAALIFEQDAQRLKEMAALGNGVFRDFENNEQVNYLNFPIGSLRRSYVVKQFYASNFSAGPDSDPSTVDSDSDGLSDWLELDAGLDPRNPDTDHDGFSDGVEWQQQQKGGSLDPLKFNDGCNPNRLHLDTDCDGLWDCDEDVLGGDFRKVDTDGDGAPDGVEWRLGTALGTPDLGFDPDSDGLLNGIELKVHSNPLINDAANLSQFGYTYQLVENGPPTPEGIQCYSFTVGNILLENTLDLGKGAGFNDLYLGFSMVPSDDPTAPPLLRQLRYREARYPVNGIKVPADGIIPVQASDFHDLCLPTDPPVWTDVP